MKIVKQLRLQHDWSQQYLANRINKTQAYISQLEKGKVGVDTDTLQELASVFKVTTDELLERTPTNDQTPGTTQATRL